MARTNFLAPLSMLSLAGIVPLAIACNGHVVVGDTGPTLQKVTPTAAAANVEPSSPVTCADGWAHPNICCESSANSPTTCGSWTDSPFLNCATAGSGWTTYPNQTQCCDLSAPGTCVSTSAPTGASTGTSSTSGSSSGAGSSSTTAPVPPPAYGCGFACPPGWWTQAIAASTSGTGETAPGCCTLEAGGALSCALQGNQLESTPSCSVPVPTLSDDAGVGYEDAGVSYDDAGVGYGVGYDDAGSDDASTLLGGEDGCGDAGGYWPGYDGGATSLCYACPQGWSASYPAQPELCCQTIAGGPELCFSQATGWASGGSSSSSSGVGSSGSSGGEPTEPADAGVISTPSSGASWSSAGASVDGAAAPSCTGSSVSCSCEDTVNGHTYALDCYVNSSGIVTCGCTIDGTATASTPTVDSCEDENGVASAFSTASSGCGFP